jgi:lipoprotein signal peptidase
MTAIVLGLILVPLLDQGVKRLVISRVGTASIPLGVLGRLRVVRAPIWMARAHGRTDLRLIWIAWALAAGGLTIVPAPTSSFLWFSAFLLGGSLSHAIEMSLRGSVCDYVCLSFWPPFNLADVVLTIGASGLVAEIVTAVHRATS